MIKPLLVHCYSVIYHEDRYRSIYHVTRSIRPVGCITIFHKYFCYTKRVGITTNLYMEDGLKHIMFYVHKHIAPLAMCHNPALVRYKPLVASVSVKLV